MVLAEMAEPEGGCVAPGRSEGSAHRTRKRPKPMRFAVQLGWMNSAAPLSYVVLTMTESAVAVAVAFGLGLGWVAELLVLSYLRSAVNGAYSSPSSPISTVLISTSWPSPRRFVMRAMSAPLDPSARAILGDRVGLDSLGDRVGLDSRGSLDGLILGALDGEMRGAREGLMRGALDGEMLAPASSISLSSSRLPLTWIVRGLLVVGDLVTALVPIDIEVGLTEVGSWVGDEDDAGER